MFARRTILALPITLSLSLIALSALENRSLKVSPSEDPIQYTSAKNNVERDTLENCVTMECTEFDYVPIVASLNVTSATVGDQLVVRVAIRNTSDVDVVFLPSLFALSAWYMCIGNPGNEMLTRIYLSNSEEGLGGSMSSGVELQVPHSNTMKLRFLSLGKGETTNLEFRFDIDRARFFFNEPFEVRWVSPRIDFPAWPAGSPSVAAFDAENCAGKKIVFDKMEYPQPRDTYGQYVINLYNDQSPWVTPTPRQLDELNESKQWLTDTAGTFVANAFCMRFVDGE